mgnify:CR=1 FL=1
MVGSRDGGYRAGWKPWEHIFLIMRISGRSAKGVGISAHDMLEIDRRGRNVALWAIDYFTVHDKSNRPSSALQSHATTPKHGFLRHRPPSSLLTLSNTCSSFRPSSSLTTHMAMLTQSHSRIRYINTLPPFPQPSHQTRPAIQIFTKMEDQKDHVSLTRFIQFEKLTGSSSWSRATLFLGGFE